MNDEWWLGLVVIRIKCCIWTNGHGNGFECRMDLLNYGMVFEAL